MLRQRKNKLTGMLKLMPKELVDLIKNASELVRDRTNSPNTPYIDVAELRKLAKGKENERKKKKSDKAGKSGNSKSC